MNKIVKGMLIGCGAIMLSAGAFAQDYGRDRANFQERDRGHWDRDRMVREYRGAFYDRLQADLSRAERSRYLRGDDLRAFDRAHREVGEFQAKWSRGVFDAREMDQAIAAVQRVTEIAAMRREH